MGLGCKKVPNTSWLGILGIVLASFAPSASGARDPIDLGQGLELRELKPGVHVVTYDQANGLMVRMGNGEIVVVNTLYHPRAAENLLEWIKARYHRYPSVAINTHFHNDTLGGNAAFINKNIPIYGSDLTVDTLREREGAMRRLLMEWAKSPEAKQAIASQRFVPPTRVFASKSGFVLKFGKERVLLRFPGPAHAPDNIVVYFENQKVLFGGCMIMAGVKVGNKSDADLALWPKAVKNVKNFKTDFVIPGHGVRFDPGLLDHTLKLLAEDSVQANNDSYISQ